jgi:hypothetical protein
MDLTSILGAAAAALIALYLGCALLAPEWFE